jgi:hypothetical protein
MGVPLPGTVGGASSAHAATQRHKTTSHFMELRMIPPKAAVNEPAGTSTPQPENG